MAPNRAPAPCARSCKGQACKPTWQEAGSRPGKTGWLARAVAARALTQKGLAAPGYVQKPKNVPSLSHLRSLARTGLANHDEHLVLSNQLHQLFAGRPGGQPPPLCVQPLPACAAAQSREWHGFKTGCWAPQACKQAGRAAPAQDRAAAAPGKRQALSARQITFGPLGLTSWLPASPALPRQPLCPCPSPAALHGALGSARRQTLITQCNTTAPRGVGCCANAASAACGRAQHGAWQSQVHCAQCQGNWQSEGKHILCAACKGDI